MDNILILQKDYAIHQLNVQVQHLQIVLLGHVNRHVLLEHMVIQLLKPVLVIAQQAQQNIFLIQQQINVKHHAKIQIIIGMKQLLHVY